MKKLGVCFVRGLFLYNYIEEVEDDTSLGFLAASTASRRAGKHFMYMTLLKLQIWDREEADGNKRCAHSTPAVSLCQRSSSVLHFTSL